MTDPQDEPQRPRTPPPPYERRPLFPAFPNSKVLPWVLAAISLAVLVVGLVTSDESLLVVGVIGAAAFLVAFPLATWILGHGEDADGPPRPPTSP